MGYQMCLNFLELLAIALAIKLFFHICKWCGSDRFEKASCIAWAFDLLLVKTSMFRGGWSASSIFNDSVSLKLLTFRGGISEARSMFEVHYTHFDSIIEDSLMHIPATAGKFFFDCLLPFIWPSCMLHAVPRPRLRYDLVHSMICFVFWIECVSCNWGLRWAHFCFSSLLHRSLAYIRCWLWRWEIHDRIAHVAIRCVLFALFLVCRIWFGLAVARVLWLYLWSPTPDYWIDDSLYIRGFRLASYLILPVAFCCDGSWPPPSVSSPPTIGYQSVASAALPAKGRSSSKKTQ